MTPEMMRSQWELYSKAWSAGSGEERKGLLSQCLLADFGYVDPRIECHGYGEITKLMEAFQERQPGGRFALRSIFAHHGTALVNWQLVTRDGTASNLGFDFVKFDESGKIRDVTGFFVPPAANES